MAKEQHETQLGFSPVYPLKILGIMILSAIILLFAAALFFAWKPMSDAVMRITVLGISAVSSALGGFCAARHYRKKGLLCGLVSGAVYTLVLYIAGIILRQSFLISPGGLLSVLILICCGGIGGIIGINTRK